MNQLALLDGVVDAPSDTLSRRPVRYLDGSTYAPKRDYRGRRVVVLSWGLGVESSAILARWLDDASSRDFELEDLIVVTCCLGDEHAGTLALAEAHVLPRLRAAGVRLVQISRAGRLEADGIVVLDDSTAPQWLAPVGVYTLYDELLAASTIPQFGGDHVCALHHKVFVAEAWIAAELGGCDYEHVWGYAAEEERRIASSEQHNAARNADARAARGATDLAESPAPSAGVPYEIVFGFNADEETRIARAQTFDVGMRRGVYPLAKSRWNWSRATCVAYLYERFGVIWPKSACVFCPFNRLDADGIARLRLDPVHVARALFLEHVALCLNPRSTLFKGKSLRSIVERDGNRAALDALDAHLESIATVYLFRVRRRYTSPGHADRATECLASGTRAEMDEAFRTIARGLVVREEHGVARAYRHERPEDVYPCIEELFVVVPAEVDSKTRYGFDHFERRWAEHDKDATLAAGAVLQRAMDFDDATHPAAHGLRLAAPRTEREPKRRRSAGRARSGRALRRTA